MKRPSVIFQPTQHSRVAVCILVFTLILPGCATFAQPTATPSPIPPTLTFTPTITYTPVPPTATVTHTPTRTNRPTFTPTNTLKRKPIFTLTPQPTGIPASTEMVTEESVGFLTPTPMTTRVYSDTAFIIPNFEGTALSFAWSKDAQYLYIGTRERGLATYDSTRRKVISYVGSDAWVQALAISPDGMRIVTAGGGWHEANL